MATTYIRQPVPDVDHALALAHRAVDTLTGQVSSPRVVGYITGVTRHLGPYRRNPSVRAFTERVRTLANSSAA